MEPLTELEKFEILHDNAQDIFSLEENVSMSPAAKLYVSKGKAVLQEFPPEIIDVIKRFSFPSNCLPLQVSFDDGYV